jgi:two-component system nitrate/nitrite sensor histidine kinase NarX
VNATNVNVQNQSDSDAVRHRLIRWSVAGITVLLILLFELVESFWPADRFSAAGAILVDILLLLLGGAAYLVVDRLLRSLDENRALRQRIGESEKMVAEAHRRLTGVFRTSQMFAGASEEKEVIELVLQLSIELVGAKGASFVSLDEHGQALPAMSAGELPYPESDAWVEYLASPAVRQKCASCQNKEQLTLVCPLLRGSFLGTMGIYCLPLRRGEHEFGVLNLYIPQPGGLDDEAQAILRTIIEETLLAMESVRLRKRELTTLLQLQAVRERTDLKTLLSSLIRTLQEALDADFAILSISGGGPGQEKDTVVSGDLPANFRHLVDGVLNSVITSQKPVLLGNVAGEMLSSPGFRSLLAVPLAIHDRPALGALLMASRQSKPFSPRQLAMLQTIGGQIAMVVQNFDLVAELEYKTMVQERTRLAREIHDGLAQTLGFLKLKSAQMMNYLDRGEIDLLRKTLQTSNQSLAEAYLDARQAIDGLRISTFEGGIAVWLKQTVEDFREYNDLTVHFCEPIADVELPPEVHAQLIRIVQEALSNVRKHAHARQIWVSCQLNTGDLILEVQDDGEGFCLEDLPGPSQHGLRGMRERAELIGGDFQIIGGPQQGISVRVRLPLEIAELDRSS